MAQELAAAGVFGPEAVREAREVGAGEGGEGCDPLALLPERCPSPEDLARLPRLNAFINEAMRLFPAAAVSTERWAGGRAGWAGEGRVAGVSPATGLRDVHPVPESRPATGVCQLTLCCGSRHAKPDTCPGSPCGALPTHHRRRCLRNRLACHLP